MLFYKKNAWHHLSLQHSFYYYIRGRAQLASHKHSDIPNSNIVNDIRGSHANQISHMVEDKKHAEHFQNIGLIWKANYRIE